jgi:hypothetical protein
VLPAISSDGGKGLNEIACGISAALEFAALEFAALEFDGWLEDEVAPVSWIAGVLFRAPVRNVTMVAIEARAATVPPMALKIMTGPLRLGSWAVLEPGCASPTCSYLEAGCEALKTTLSWAEAIPR